MVPRRLHREDGEADYVSETAITLCTLNGVNSRGNYSQGMVDY